MSEPELGCSSPQALTSDGRDRRRRQFMKIFVQGLPDIFPSTIPLQGDYVEEKVERATDHLYRLPFRLILVRRGRRIWLRK